MNPLMLECPECKDEYDLHYTEESERDDCPASCEFNSCPHCGSWLNPEQLADAVDTWKSSQAEIGVD